MSSESFVPGNIHRCPKGFPGGAVVKDPPAEARDTNVVGLIPGSGRSPGEGNGNPLQRSLGGYCPWGCKELDTTKHTHTHGKIK